MNDNVIYTNAFKRKEQESEEKEDTTFDSTVTDIAIAATFQITDDLKEFGFDINSNPECAYDIILIIESIKSAMYSTRGIQTGLNKISRELYPKLDVAKIMETILDESDIDY